MHSDNFISFFTVCGFFVGLMFSVFNALGPFELLMYTFGITLFFYLFIHIVVMNFMDVHQAGKRLFDHRQYEEISAYFIHELQEREKRMETLIDTNVSHEGSVVTNTMREYESTHKKAA
jgi:hypothetical protein